DRATQYAEQLRLSREAAAYWFPAFAGMTCECVADIAPRLTSRLLPRKPHAQSSRQFLRELPGDAARPRAARGRPFQRLALQRFVIHLDAVMAAIAAHHRQIF